MDTGASRSLCSYRFYQQISQQSRGLTTLKRASPLVTITGEPLKVRGQLKLWINGNLEIQVSVIEDLPIAILIGNDTLLKYKGQLNYGRQSLILGGTIFKFKSKFHNQMTCAIGDTRISNDDKRITRLLSEYCDIFYSEGNPVTKAKGIPPMTIQTTGKPIALRAYRAPFSKRQVISDEVDAMLRDGIIRPSQSPWSSPVLLIPKRDQTARFCVDYRALNAITKRDVYPLPYIQDIFDTIGQGNVFTTLDLKSGYWQLEVAPEDREKTAFTCHRGHFEFNRISFGLTNAPAVFQRAMDRILSPVIGRCALVYIDDIVVFSRSMTDHVSDLREVFNLLRRANLKLKSSKCEFAKPQVELLGYEISSKGITPLREKASAIRELPRPRNLKALRSYLGICNFYRQCMRGYATVAEPLVRLTRKSTPFEWGDAQERAFIALKAMLISPEVMAYPNLQKPYKLYTDACEYAIGGILVQTDEAGVERVIQYISHQLSPTQRRWATIEKEAYAVVYALTKLRTYLFGAQFTVYTDHKPLKSLFTKEMANTKIQRWAVLLAEYGAKIEYRQGKNNIRADMLSRIESEHAEVAIITERAANESDVNNSDSISDDYDVLNTDGISRAQLIRNQDREFPNELKDARENDDSDYTIREGVLFSERCPYPGAEVKPRIMLTTRYRQRIIDRAHLEVGHMAANKTQKRVVEEYVWPGLRKDVRLRLKSCAICEAYHRRPVHVQMQEIEVPATPMELVGLDFIGPFPPDQYGRKYLLTAIDYLSGWAEAYPTKTQSAGDIIDSIANEFLPRHGHPRAFISDNGQGFGSRQWSEFLAQCSIGCRRTTPVHPQGNAKIERFNRTYKEAMAKLVLNKPSDWADRVSDVLTAYRHSVSTSTGFTPFYLLYGRHPRAPLEKFLGENQFGNRLDDLASAYKTARANTYEARKYNRQRLNKLANVSTSLQVGDTVTIKAEERLTNTSRWDPQWEVYRVRGTTHWIRHQTTGREKKLHREKLHLVDPNIVWDELPTRPKRQGRPRVNLRK